jgi:hypothetical protein
MRSEYRDVKYSQIVTVRNQTEALRELNTGVLVLVMPNKRPKSLKFLCPCGCSEIISVNLMPGNERAWRVDYNAKLGLSLWPSVWRTSGCCSHFILRRNKARLLHGKVPRMSATDTKKSGFSNLGLSDPRLTSVKGNSPKRRFKNTDKDNL